AASAQIYTLSLHDALPIFVAPSYRDADGPPIEWRKEIDLDLGDGKSATGFVAIREIANTRLAGLALFRRKRLIMGSADEAYRPRSEEHTSELQSREKLVCR